MRTPADGPPAVATGPGGAWPAGRRGLSPAWWRGSRDLRWLAVRTLARLAPATGLRVAAWGGGLAHRAGLLGPTPALLGALLPDRAPEERRRLSRAVAARSAMNHCLADLVARGAAGALGRLVDRPSRARLASLCERGALVLASFHAGAWLALGDAVAGLSRPVLILERAGTLATGRGPRVERLHVDGARSQSRARALMRALEFLNAGGIVLLLPDAGLGHGEHGGSVLDRRLALASGAAVLGVRARVAVVPLIARWARGRTRVELRIGDPIEPAGPEPEAGMCRELAHWFDGHLRAHPEDLSAHLARRLLARPAAPR